MTANAQLCNILRCLERLGRFPGVNWESFVLQPVEGMLSHQLEQNRIDGDKTIIQNPTEAQKKEHEKFDFELHEVNIHFQKIVDKWRNSIERVSGVNA